MITSRYLVVATLLTLVIVASTGCTSGGGGGSKAIDWSEPSLSLSAADLTLVVDGVTFHGDPATTELKLSINGDNLDASWTEAGYAERLYLGFTAGTGTWWIDDVRVRRLDNSDWWETHGEFFTTPAGQPLEGDLDFAIADHATLHITSARLATLRVQ
jgi:hypothetical protein